MGNPSLPWICYPRITLIGYFDLGTRVVRVLLWFWLTREWSVVVHVLHNVDLDLRGLWCVQVYTGLYDLHVLHVLHVLPEF